MIFFLALLALVSPEQIVHGPYTPAAQRLDRLAVAGDERTLFIAYTEVTDEGGEIVSIRKPGEFPVQMMLSTSNARRADMPSLARIGDRYLLAWREELATPNPSTPSQRTLAARFDANSGRVDYVPFNLHETLPIVDFSQNMFAIAAGDVFRVFSAWGGRTWESRISLAGGLLQPADVVVAHTSAATAASNGRSTAFGSISVVPLILPLPPPPQFFGVYGEGETQARFSTLIPQFRDSVPSIATNGSDYLVVWREREAIRGLRLDADARPVGNPFLIAETEPTRNTFAAVRVVVTWSGSRYIVAWDAPSRDTHDIFGAAVSADGSVTLFDITKTSADERLPAIATTSHGRVVVAYQLFAGSQSRIAVRTVSDPPTRPRATRTR